MNNSLREEPLTKDIITRGKICSDSKCKSACEIQPLSNFHKNVRNKDGHEGRCKDCVSRSKKKRRKLLKRNKKSRQLSGKTKVLDVTSCRFSEHKVIIEDSCEIVFREFIREVLSHE